MNRGQRAPEGGGGAGAGSGGHDGGRVDAMDVRGSGGTDGGAVACTVTDGGAGMDGGGGSDAGDAAAAMTCGALMSFENCVVYGAMLLGPIAQRGFTGFSAIASPTFCGAGALAIETNLLMPTDADKVSNVGELYLTIPGGPLNLGGKTVTVHASTNTSSTNLTSFYLTPVNTDTLYGPGSAKVSPLRSTQWTTASASFAVGEPLVERVDRFSIQVISNVDYQGTVYVDEIEITTTPPDAGAADGDAADARPADAREGGATDTPADVRDGAAGN